MSCWFTAFYHSSRTYVCFLLTVFQLSLFFSYLCTCLCDSSAGELRHSALAFYHPIKLICIHMHIILALLLPQNDEYSCFFDLMQRLWAHLQSRLVFSQAWCFFRLFKQGSLIPPVSKIQQMMRSHRYTRTPSHEELIGCGLQVLQTPMPSLMEFSVLQLWAKQRGRERTSSASPGGILCCAILNTPSIMTGPFIHHILCHVQAASSLLFNGPWNHPHH